MAVSRPAAPDRTPNTISLGARWTCSIRAIGSIVRGIVLALGPVRPLRLARTPHHLEREQPHSVSLFSPPGKTSSNEVTIAFS